MTIDASATDHLTEDGVANAVITSSLCPNAPVTADAVGNLSIRVPASKDFYLRATRLGYAPSLTPELNFDADGLTVVRLFPATPATAPVAASLAIGPLFAPIVESDDNFPPSGVIVTVAGAPVAVSYPNAAWLGTQGTSTDARGHVVVSGMTAASVLTRAAAKPTCKVVWLTNNETGRLRFENGAITTHVIYVACDL